MARYFDLRDTELSILEVFRKHPAKELSTTTIIDQSQPTYQRIKEALQSNDREQLKKAKRQKAELHRDIQYYLKKFEKKGIIQLVRRVGRTHETHYKIINPDYAFPIPFQTITPSLGIEGYEEKKIVHRYDSEYWLERVNSILLESTYFKNIRDLSQAFFKTIVSVNDVVGINDFETIIQQTDASAIISTINSWNKLCEDYARTVSIIIDITNLTQPEKVISVIKETLKLEHVSYVFDTQTKEYSDNRDFFKQLIQIYSSHSASLFIKNQTAHAAPYMCGKTGPYTFCEREWNSYKKQLQGKIPGLVCGMTTYLVDIHKLFETKGDPTTIVIDLMGKITKTLLFTSSEQQERSEQIIQGLVSINPEQAQNYFLFARNFVRFWNYGWKTPHFDQALVKKYLAESKKAVDEYCLSEETIYRGCGFPVRFRMAYACADKKIAESTSLSLGTYQRVTINSPSSLITNSENRNIVNTKLSIFKQFDGGDRITFDRTSVQDTNDVLNEISYVLHTYNLPFFSYKFIKSKETTLVQYL